MHELALSQGIVELVLAHARREGLRSVTRIVLEVGAAAGVEPESLRFCFEAAAFDTAAQGAELRIDAVPLRGRCRECGLEFEPPGLMAACPRCQAYAPRFTSGRELRVKEFEGC